MIPAVIERCAGIDIGKKMVAVCVMTGAADQEPHCEIREFGTTTGELQQVCASGCKRGNARMWPPKAQDPIGSPCMRFWKSISLLFWRTPSR